MFGDQYSLQLLLVFGAAALLRTVTGFEEKVPTDQQRSSLSGVVEEDEYPEYPSNFYCVLVMKNQQELECFFIAWPGTNWSLSYITNLASNAISGWVNFACDRRHCGVNVSGSAQLYTTYNFTLHNLSASARDGQAITYHAVYSDDYIIRLNLPENLVVKPENRQVLLTWNAPLSSYGVLEFELEDLATKYGLEHEVSHYISAPQLRLIEVKKLATSQLENISLVLMDLQPFSAYAVQIRSRVNCSTLDHLWSEPTTAIFRTAEEAPEVAPEIVQDGFYLSTCNASHCVVKIYWKGIPEAAGQSNGVIRGYLVKPAGHKGHEVERVLVGGSRRLTELRLDMRLPRELVVLGLTSAGAGPPSVALRIPSLPGVLYLNSCSINVKELNKTAVQVSWSVNNDVDIQAVRLYWCLIVYSECGEILTADKVYGRNGSEVITTDDGPIDRYRFGLSAAAQGFASGIVWRHCSNHQSGAQSLTLQRVSDSGLPRWAVVGIVAAITMAICAVSLFLWWFMRQRKSIKNIRHIPKTHSISMVNLTTSKYEAVVREELMPSLMHTNCSWKDGNGLIQSPKRDNGDHVQHSEIPLDLSQHATLLEASIDHERPLVKSTQPCPRTALLQAAFAAEPRVGDSLASESSSENGYPVSFQDLIDQSRKEGGNLQANTSERDVAGILNVLDLEIDRSGSLSFASWGDLVLADGKVLQAESHFADESRQPQTKLSPWTYSHPLSDYVMIASIEQQIEGHLS